MERNLDRRVEILFPVLDAKHREHLKSVVLDQQLSDNTLAFLLQEEGNYIKTMPENDPEAVDSQNNLLRWYSEKNRPMEKKDRKK